VEWDENDEWDLHDSALFGSSFYDLPTPLRWISGNIGIHHVHHLYSRIPFYRLTEVLKDHPVLKNIRRMTFKESLRCVRLHLWDEQERRMIGFSDLRA
jgi:omega-6 fatty acid desaturase (delta-12 desaturase)